MQLHNILKALRVLPDIGPALEWFGGVYTNGGNAETPRTLVYGAAIPIDLSTGNFFTVTITDGNAFVVSNPTGAPATGFGQLFTILFRNASGGALGAGTFGTAYKVSAAVAAIANGNSQSVTFQWDGTNAVEVWRSAADTPN